MKKQILLGTLISAFMSVSSTTLACTDFRLIAKDGTPVITRSMEFALDLKSNLRTSNRGRVFNNITPDGKSGFSWKATYGYLFLDGLNVDATIDGINEQGLSFEYLYLPAETKYQEVPIGQEGQAIGYMQFGDWVLGNFKNVDEVREALPKIFVFAQKIPGMGDMIYPLHAAIHDATGNSIVIEFVNGTMRVYDNKIGVLTNSPTYKWHIANLRNYLNLTPLTPQPIKAEGMTFIATGQGSGMLGLPGDVSPPSRFVKTAVMLQTVFPTNNAADTVNLAEHIINNVDIPLGFVREAQTGKATNEYTQWVVFKDLNHKIFYYRTYDNLTLRSISLANVNLSENAPRLKMPLDTHTPTIQDMTADFTRKR